MYFAAVGVGPHDGGAVQRDVSVPHGGRDGAHRPGRHPLTPEEVLSLTAKVQVQHTSFILFNFLPAWWVVVIGSRVKISDCTKWFGTLSSNIREQCIVKK